MYGYTFCWALVSHRTTARARARAITRGPISASASAPTSTTIRGQRHSPDIRLSDVPSNVGKATKHGGLGVILCRYHLVLEPAHPRFVTSFSCKLRTGPTLLVLVDPNTTDAVSTIRNHQGTVICCDALPSEEQEHARKHRRLVPDQSRWRCHVFNAFPLKFQMRWLMTRATT